MYHFKRRVEKKDSYVKSASFKTGSSVIAYTEIENEAVRFNKMELATIFREEYGIPINYSIVLCF